MVRRRGFAKEEGERQARLLQASDFSGNDGEGNHLAENRRGAFCWCVTFRFFRPSSLLSPLCQGGRRSADAEQRGSGLRSVKKEPCSRPDVCLFFSKIRGGDQAASAARDLPAKDSRRDTVHSRRWTNGLENGPMRNDDVDHSPVRRGGGHARGSLPSLLSSPVCVCCFIRSTTCCISHLWLAPLVDNFRCDCCFCALVFLRLVCASKEQEAGEKRCFFLRGGSLRTGAGACLDG